MEDSFEQAARIAELLAETAALDWDLNWHPDAPADSGVEGPAAGVGWRPDRGVDLDPHAGADPGADPAGPGTTGLEGTDPMVRRWRIEQITAGRAQMARLQALEARHLAALSDTVRAATEPEPNTVPGTSSERLEWAFRSLTAELAVACRVSSRTMQSRLAEAHLLVGQFPATLTAWQEGRIEAGHVRTIMLHGASIDEADARAEYEGIVLQQAALVSPGRLAKHAQLTATRVGNVSFEERHRKAREDRCVRLSGEDHGMSRLVLYLPTLHAGAIWDRLTQQTKAIHQATMTNTDDGGGADNAAGHAVRDPRTFDQIRTDLACDLLLTGQPSGGPDAPHTAGIGIRAEVSVVIPVLSLLDKTALGKPAAGKPAVAGGGQPDPAMLAGYGPIGMDDALGLAADAPQWVRVLTHPVTGMVLTVDTYRPSKKLRHFLRIRDGRCRFPTCNRPPRRTEIDHTHDWDYGGKTRPDNLECLCKAEHLLKHHSAWKLRQISPGVLEWTSPLGQIITDQPDTDIPGATTPF
jgi:hypothetical protein